MATKMLLLPQSGFDTSVHNELKDACYCIPCGKKLVNSAEVSVSTDVKNRTCTACGMLISTLPEPPDELFAVGLAVTMRVDLNASCSAEAMQRAFDALDMRGVEDWECTSQDTFLLT